MIKKLPYKALVVLHVKGDYKSNDPDRFEPAYRNTFFMVKGTLNHFNHACSSNFEGMISLFFPPKKVIAASEDKNLAKTLVRMKGFTSVKQISILMGLNPWI